MKACNVQVYVMRNNDKFELNSFLAPDNTFSPVYIWVWNDVCTREIIDEQLSEMQRLGIRSFYILPEPEEFRPGSMPTFLSPGYLSDEYFELCAYAVDKGTHLGMSCWIYDEGGWPSGSACGRVVKDHPEYSEGGSYPDLMNKDAVEYFIEITHKKYTSATRRFSAVFTDEPKAPMKPFNEALADKYKKMYGEEILPYRALIDGTEKPTTENIYVLRRWYDLCSREFCENYLLPCKKWANENGFLFTGHLDKDHRADGCMKGGGNFNLMRALRCFDIPGIDVIWRQLYPENESSVKNDMNAFNGFFPRYASSAAAQKGTKLAMSEIFGVAGPGLTYDIMRFTVGYQAVRGINIFNPFNFPLGRKGQLLAQELPVFTENQPYYSFLPQFNRYTERLSYIASVGERVCDTALYYPVSDFWGSTDEDTVAKKFEAVGRSLEDLSVDFDIADDDVIQTAEITSDGYMQIGKARYKSIVIPEGAFIPEATQNSLARFTEKGGQVLYELSSLKPVADIEGKGLRVMKRITENSEIFCLFRETGENGDYIIHLPSSKGYILEIESGKLYKLNAENDTLSLSLHIGETAVILLTDEEFPSEEKKEFPNRIDIPAEFTLRKDTELLLGENGFYCINHSEKEISVKLGDWSYLIGSDYSGSCTYELSFTLPDEKIGKDGQLSLGDVHYSASVYLNDSYIGTAVMSPYNLKIPEGYLKKENRLKIVVTNTSANRYVYTDYFDKWTIKELSPYFEAELSYAKDFTSGGLYGPVTLYTE